MAVGLEALANLDGQLARWGEDQRPNRPPIGSRKRIARLAVLPFCFCFGAGPLASAGLTLVLKRWSVGSANAAVLPVPVWAQPIRSRPASTAESPAAGSASPSRNPRRVRREAVVRLNQVDQKLSRNVSIFPTKGICSAADGLLTQGLHCNANYGLARLLTSAGTRRSKIISRGRKQKIPGQRF